MSERLDGRGRPEKERNRDLPPTQNPGRERSQGLLLIFRRTISTARGPTPPKSTEICQRALWYEYSVLCSPQYVKLWSSAITVTDTWRITR